MKLKSYLSEQTNKKDLKNKYNFLKKRGFIIYIDRDDLLVYKTTDWVGPESKHRFIWVTDKGWITRASKYTNEKPLASGKEPKELDKLLGK